MNAYDFKVKAQNGSEISLSDYEGKVLLIVNTATGCGFTPQYDDLQRLYNEYNDKGFEILDFPCNQFGNQLTGDNNKIHTFCKGRFGITFPQFSKTDVKGENASPLYKWLSENTKFKGFDKNPTGLMLSQILKKQDKNYDKDSSVKWNFTKFLIDKNGEIAARFEPMTSLKKIEKKIEELL